MKDISIKINLGIYLMLSNTKMLNNFFTIAVNLVIFTIPANIAQYGHDA